MLSNEMSDRTDPSDIRRDALDPKVRPSEAYEAVHTMNRLLDQLSPGDQLHEWQITALIVEAEGAAIKAGCCRVHRPGRPPRPTRESLIRFFTEQWSLRSNGRGDICRL
jgi:hypothetical protein